MNRRSAYCYLLLATILAGCSSEPDRIATATFTPADVAKAAMAQYDVDGDGQIAGPELDKAASLKWSIKKIDTNHDGKISEEEIAARITAWQEKKVGQTVVTITVRLDGKPLAGAQVTLVPEKFMNDAIAVSSGVTSDTGTVVTVPKGMIGTQPGYYTVEISKLDNGKEIIPARYNKKTELGIEITSEYGDLREFNLDSKPSAPKSSLPAERP